MPAQGQQWTLGHLELLVWKYILAKKYLGSHIWVLCVVSKRWSFNFTLLEKGPAINASACLKQIHQHEQSLMDAHLCDWEVEIRGFKGLFCEERHACCCSCPQTSSPHFAPQVIQETSLRNLITAQIPTKLEHVLDQPRGFKFIHEMQFEKGRSDHSYTSCTGKKIKDPAESKKEEEMAGTWQMCPHSVPQRNPKQDL